MTNVFDTPEETEETPKINVVQCHLCPLKDPAHTHTEILLFIINKPKKEKSKSHRITLNVA